MIFVWRLRRAGLDQHRRQPGCRGALLAAALLFVAAMSAQASSNDSPAPIKVALVLAKTGIAAADNEPAFEGALLAVEEINAAGGVLQRPLDILFLDNHSTPLGAKHAAEEAVRQDVAAVIGALWSSHSMAMAAVLQAAGIPMISPTATKPELTRMGDYIFRAGIDDTLQGRVLARFALDDLKGRTAVVIKNISEEYCLTLASNFIRFFTDRGGRLLGEGNYMGKAVDFADTLEDLKPLKADIIFIPGYARDSGLIVKQAVQMGVQGVFLGGDGWGEQMVAFAGDALEGAYYSTQWHPEVDFERNRHLQSLYRRRFAKQGFSDMRIALTYDAFALLADAIRRAGSLQRGRIRDALAATADFEGASGSISFDVHGDPQNKAAAIIQFHDGRNVFVKTVAAR
jgi:branched-chain amino acid transport system substrate-binding protein